MKYYANTTMFLPSNTRASQKTIAQIAEKPISRECFATSRTMPAKIARRTRPHSNDDTLNIRQSTLRAGHIRPTWISATLTPEAHVTLLAPESLYQMDIIHAVMPSHSKRRYQALIKRIILQHSRSDSILSDNNTQLRSTQLEERLRT